MSCHLNEELARAVFGNEGSAKFKEYEQALQIREQVAQIKFRMGNLLIDYEGNMKQCDEQLAKLQKECKHQMTKGLPNPAGERSESECLICGKVL